MINPREIYEAQFKAAAGEGALLELRLRLLADMIPTIRGRAFGKNFVDIEVSIVEHFSANLTQTEKDEIALGRKLRNKILHADFSALREKLTQLGVPPNSGGVRKVDITGLDGNDMGRKLYAALSGASGTSEAVADTPTAAGGILAWFLEAGSAGDFRKAIEVFPRIMATLDRLATI